MEVEEVVQPLVIGNTPATGDDVLARLFEVHADIVSRARARPSPVNVDVNVNVNVRRS